MKKTTFKFLTVLLLVLAVVFAAHLFILQNMEMPIFSDRIVLSYGINYALAAAILIFIQSKFNKKSSHTGFIFLGGSGLNFLVFFLVFYPFYREDGTMATSDFAAFFVAIDSCLIFEVACLSKPVDHQNA